MVRYGNIIINKIYIDCNRFDILILKIQKKPLIKEKVLMLSNKECNSTGITIRTGIK